jgi:hypothetical protein
MSMRLLFPSGIVVISMLGAAGWAAVASPTPPETVLTPAIIIYPAATRLVAIGEAQASAPGDASTPAPSPSSSGGSASTDPPSTPRAGTTFTPQPSPGGLQTVPRQVDDVGDDAWEGRPGPHDAEAATGHDD